MKLIKFNWHNYFLIILFLVNLTGAVNGDGCFTYQESKYYCQNINLETATGECNKHTGCVLEPIFASNTSCSLLKECNTVICRDSCKDNFIGKCIAGSFEPNLTQQICEPVLSSSVTEGNKTWGLWLLLIFFILALGYYIYNIIIYSLTETSKNKLESPTLKSGIFSPFNFNSQQRFGLNKVKQERQQKIKQDKRENFLVQQGLGITKAVQKAETELFSKLDNLAKTHQRTKLNQLVKDNKAVDDWVKVRNWRKKN
ncbi:MAG TPA: hypothetical protein VJC39_03870 [Candidatus Nanoarchaeia archaeon]|nr:hypothetical protein [Candidatus Nanoarchaeia archaeon]